MVKLFLISILFAMLLELKYTLAKEWENSKNLWKHSLAARVPQHFSFSQTFNGVSVKQLGYEFEISIAR